MKCAPLLYGCLLLCLSACSGQDDGVFQGYVEGEYVYLASSEAGRLDALHTERGATVASGTLLFALEADYERLALDQAEREAMAAVSQLEDMETGKRPEELAVAEAQLAQAQADAANAQALLRRHENLVKTGSISRQEFEDSQTAARTTAARVAELTSQLAVDRLPEREQRIEAQRAEAAAAAARVAQARWTLDQKEVRAPAAGLVYDTLYRVGEWVPAGNPVVQLLPPGNVTIRFFVPESLIGSVRTGGRVLVRADGWTDRRDDETGDKTGSETHPDAVPAAPAGAEGRPDGRGAGPSHFPAVITYVAGNAEYTPPVIYSNETRSKLVFMVEARPEPRIAATLHPGQPVSVSLP